MKYAEALEYMESLAGYGIVPGLDSIRRLCEKMNQPQKDLAFVHIAGTNGKGSVLAYVSTILKCAGYKVGRYISPTISEYRERFQINNKPISKKAFGELAEYAKGICEQIVAEGFSHPTPFELETAVAFQYFKEQGCDIVVLETGMGGLNDATNVIETTKVAVLTSISMDHMGFLGKTLEEIGAQKAGIIKKGCRVVTLSQTSEVMEVICKKAAEAEAAVQVADPKKAQNIRYGLEKQRFDYKDYKNLEISLAGTYQVSNAVLALEVVKALEEQGYEISVKALRKGLLETVWPGRFSVLAKKPYFVIDGAHNEDAAKKLAQSIEFYFTNRRIVFIMGVLRDKEYEKMIQLTHKYADQILTVTVPNNKRSMSSYELASEIAKVHPNVTAADSLEEAVEIAYLLAGKEEVILVFGSLYFQGRIIEIVENRKKGLQK